MITNTNLQQTTNRGSATKTTNSQVDNEDDQVLYGEDNEDDGEHNKGGQRTGHLSPGPSGPSVCDYGRAPTS